MRIIDTQGRDVLTPSPVVEQTGRVFIARVPNVGTYLTTVSNTAYFVYLGRLTQSVVVKYVELYVQNGGSGTQTAEIGLFTTANPPNKTTQGTNGITKLTATGTVDSLTTTGVKRNTNAFNYTVAAGTYLWAGIRTAVTFTARAVLKSVPTFCGSWT